MTASSRELAFRDARADEIAAILELARSGAVEEDAAAPVDPDHPGYLAAFEAIQADPNHRLIVAERDGEIIGSLQLSFLPGLTRQGMWRGQLENIHVREDQRGAGVGFRMIAWAIERCREKGCGLVQLTSNKKRDRAHKLYRTLGFEPTHEGFKRTL